MNDTGKATDSPFFRSDKIALIIAGLALLFRWLHIAIIWTSDLTRVPIIDSAFYHLWAAQIADGKFVGEGIFFMSPLYPYFLGLLYSIFGINAGLALIVQSLLGAATVYLIYLWVDGRLGRRHASIAAGLAALYGPFIFYDGVLLTASLIVFLSALILYMADRIAERPSSLSLMSLGVVVGLSALARPLAILVLPVMWWMLFVRERASSARRWFVMLSGTAIILFAVGVRNLIVGNEFTLTTSSAGMNFYVGNNPDATGLYWEAPFLTSAEPQYEDEDYRRVASEAVDRDLTTREAGDYWFRKALNWVINEPGKYLKLLGTKAFYFWNRAEFANNISYYFGRDISPILQYNPVGFWMLAPLGLAGLVLFWRRRGAKEAVLPVGWTIAYFAGGLIFFVSSEYRLPVVLPLLLGASFFLVAFIDYLREKKTEAALRLVIIPLVILPLVNFRTTFIANGENSRMDWFNIANTLLKSDNAKAATLRFEKALAVDPYFEEGMLRLAEAYYRSGMVDSTLAVGKRAGLPDPESILKLVQGSALQEAFSLLNEGQLTQAMKEFSAAGYDQHAASAETTRVSRMNAARKAFEKGDVEQSLNHFLALLAADSLQEPAIFYNIAFLNYQLGRRDSAETFAAKALAIDSLNGPTSALLAKIYRDSGRDQEADQILKKISPEGHDKEAMLAMVRHDMDSLERVGEWEKALDVYLPYGRIFFDVVPEDKWRLGRLQYHSGNYDIALRLFSEVEAAMIVEPKVGLYQGWAQLAMGRISEAESSFQKALAADPEMVEARISLARLYLQRGQVDKSWKELDMLNRRKFTDESLQREIKGLADSIKAKI